MPNSAEQRYKKTIFGNEKSVQSNGKTVPNSAEKQAQITVASKVNDPFKAMPKKPC